MRIYIYTHLKPIRMYINISICSYIYVSTYQPPVLYNYHLLYNCYYVDYIV